VVAVGQGHALFVESPLVDGGRAVYADNFGMVRYLQRHIEKLLHAPFADESLPIIDAAFERTGNSSPPWRNASPRTTRRSCVVWCLMKPFILTMPPGAMNRPLGVYSTFVPAGALSVKWRGFAGRVFAQERFGKPRRAVASVRVGRAGPNPKAERSHHGTRGTSSSPIARSPTRKNGSPMRSSPCPAIQKVGGSPASSCVGMRPRSTRRHEASACDREFDNVHQGDARA